MTLSRQLILLVTALFVMVFAGTFLVNLHNTRAYLGAQLRSHAEDAANSLALSITPAATEGDTALITSMVDSIFDRGYYRSLSVRGPGGEPVVERDRVVRVVDVPDWFVRALPLDTPEGTALVQAGWRQGGSVHVRSHPGFAYRELWLAATQSLLWSLAALVAAVLVTGLLLRAVLRPLATVEKQARAIAERDFRPVDALPRTRELRRVVGAMNDLGSRVERMFREQTELAEGLRKQTSIDALTGLPNRTALERTLAHRLSPHVEEGVGALLLIAVPDLDQVNRSMGRAHGDQLLRDAAAQLRRVCADADGYAARLDGAEFALVLGDVDTRSAGATAASLGRFLLPPPEGTGVHVGVAPAQGGDTASALLGRADTALRVAQAGEPGDYHLLDPAGQVPSLVSAGAEQWRSVLEHAMDDGNLQLWAQPVKTASLGEVVHQEVYARLLVDGEVVQAGTFLPMAERLGLTARLDRMVVEWLMTHLAGQSPTVSHAVNLSAGTLRDPGFVPWLEECLSAAPEVARRMVFECSEAAAVAEAASVRALGTAVRARGARFGVDGFGAGTRPFGYLSTLRPDHIKVDGSFSVGIESAPEQRFVIKAIVNIARTLDIPVVAEFVETDDQWQVLRELGVDAVKGYLIGEPVALL